VCISSVVAYRIDKHGVVRSNSGQAIFSFLFHAAAMLLL